MAEARQMMRERFVQRIKEQQQRGQGGAGSLFKQNIKGLQFFNCTDGTHTIDIIPYFAGKNDPHVPEGEEAYVFEFFIHRDVGVGEGSIMCLAETYGKPCPICEDRRRKIREGIAEKSVDKLRPGRNPRSLYNIICYDSREQEDKGIQVFHTSHYLMEEQLQELASGTPIRPGQEQLDPLVLFMDPKEGKSIIWKREGKMEKTRFTGMRFGDRPKGYVIDQRDLDETWALDEIVYIPTYEEVCDFYYGKGKGPVESADDDGGGRGSSRSRSVESAQQDAPVEAGRSRRSRGGDSAPAPPAEEAKKESNPCPSGHDFGADIDKFPVDCEKCEEWRPCSRKNKEILASQLGGDTATKVEDKQEPPAAPATEGRRSRRGADPEPPPAQDPPPAEEGRRRRRA
jgi:hypothetical protein